MFDSGFGGLTVARAVIDLLPAEDLVYIGDTARYPYGPRPARRGAPLRPASWRRASSRITSVKAIIVACNTAAASGLDDLRSTLPVPIIDVVAPGASALVEATQSGRAAVIGTVGTVSSGAYLHAVEHAAMVAGREVTLTSAACPGFVEFVERGQTSGDEVTVLAERLLAPVMAADVDALLLGCTHYPFLGRVIGDVVGAHVTLVSSADETAFSAARLLGELGLLRRPDDAAGPPPLPVQWRRAGVPRARPPPPRPRARRHRAVAARAPTVGLAEGASDDAPRRPRATPSCAPSRFERDFTAMADGSCLVTFGRTKVLCTASVDENVPRWMRGSGKGWVTAEYSMLPGSSPERVDREAAKGKQSGRTVEIQRLIGRSLRAACDLTVLGERQVVVDCDVLQADGGTRTASICGGFLALHDALSRVVAGRALAAHPLHSFCAAISVGIVGGVPVLDLPYSEDSVADVDMNVVTIRPIAGGESRFVEVQGTAEGAPFSRSELDSLLELAAVGLGEIVDLQAAMIAEPPPPRPR